MTGDVALRRVDVRLVEGHPSAADVGQPLDCAGDKAAEALRGSGGEERARILEPDRIGEVVERDHRLEPTVAQAGRDLAVALERVIVPAARARLDPAPLDRHAEGVQADVATPQAKPDGNSRMPATPLLV